MKGELLNPLDKKKMIKLLWKDAYRLMKSS